MEIRDPQTSHVTVFLTKRVLHSRAETDLKITDGFFWGGGTKDFHEEKSSSSEMFTPLHKILGEVFLVSKSGKGCRKTENQREAPVPENVTRCCSLDELYVQVDSVWAERR